MITTPGGQIWNYAMVASPGGQIWIFATVKPHRTLKHDNEVCFLRDGLNKISHQKDSLLGGCRSKGGQQEVGAFGRRRPLLLLMGNSFAPGEVVGETKPYARPRWSSEVVLVLVVVSVVK